MNELPAVVPFHRRPRTERERRQAFVRSRCFDVRLEKGDRRRRYWVRPGKADDEWYCQVWFRDDWQHRGEIVRDFARVEKVIAEYYAEIRELVLDGWTITLDTRPPSPPNA